MQPLGTRVLSGGTLIWAVEVFQESAGFPTSLNQKEPTGPGREKWVLFDFIATLTALAYFPNRGSHITFYGSLPLW